MKYALSRVPKISLTLSEREDYPELFDFSDTFWMDREQYQEFLFKWADYQANYVSEEDEMSSYPESSPPKMPTGFMSGAQGMGDSNGMDITSLLENLRSQEYMDDYDDDYFDPNSIQIPGPYLAAWPNIIEPIEFEIGDAKITITIEDENAKMPLIWATLGGNKASRATALASFETFCSWMNMEDEQIDQLLDELKEMAKHKEFKLAYRPTTVTEVVRPKIAKTAGKTSARRRYSAPVKRTVKKQREPEAHAGDFAKLIHSSIINIEALAMSTYDDSRPDENPLKYLGLWGAAKININTAPRHVLEAAFTFGGEAEDIASEIIKLRREKPFETKKDLLDRLYGFSDSIKLAMPYITMNSEFMSIKVVATSGKAKSTSIAAVRKVGKNIKKVASFSY